MGRRTAASIVILATICCTAAPRNVILMIGDGMGPKHLQATEEFLSGKDSCILETFPVQTRMSTYSVKGSYSPDSVARDASYVHRKPTDSGASATAFSTGGKTYDAAIGVGPDSLPRVTLSEAAFQHGKSSGVVTTVEFSHATPAAMAAHNVTRKDATGIAREMLQRSHLSVVIGAGNPGFDKDGKPSQDTAAAAFEWVGGKDSWNMLRQGMAKNLDGKAWTLLERKAGFDSLAQGLGPTPLALAGVAQVRETLQQGRKSTSSNAAAETQPFASSSLASVPSLATMSLGALRVLDQNPKGFFLMIEGGAIDWAAHANQSARMVEETAGFLEAIDSVSAWIVRHGGWEKNLLVVVADHETGYLSGPEGPGSRLVNQGKGKLPLMRWNAPDHTNQLVRLMASGSLSGQIPALVEGRDSLGTYTDNARLGRWLQSTLALLQE